MEFDRGDGVVDFVREAGGHAAERGEAFGLFAGAAFGGELGVCLFVGAGELADLVGARSLWERLGIFVRDAGEALGERAQRTDDAACERPCETGNEVMRSPSAIPGPPTP